MDESAPLEPETSPPSRWQASSADQPTPRRWGLGDVVLGMVAGLVLSTIFGGIWLGVAGDDELGLGGRAFSQVGLWTGLIGAVVFASRRKGSGSVADDFGFRARLQDLWVGLAGGVGSQFVVVPLVVLAFRPLLGDPDVGGPVRDLVEQAPGARAMVLVMIAVVGAPVVEELFFRGLLLRSLQHRLGDGWAIITSGLAFGLAHPNDLPFEAMVLVMAGLAALGMVLALIAVRTGRLGACILAHATFNAISLAFAFAR